jgi:hypothetical protein
LKSPLKFRVVDFVTYFGIGLLLVGFVFIVAARISDDDVAAQLVTAFFSACVLVAYVVNDQGRTSERKLLVGYCAAIVVIHFAAYIFALRTLGRTRAMTAGLLTVLELVFLAGLRKRLFLASTVGDLTPAKLISIRLTQD